MDSALKARIFILGIVFGVVLAIGVDCYFFARALVNTPATSHLPAGQVDLIVALTGGKGRLKEALNFLMQNKGKNLFISGTTPGTTLESILAVNKITASIEPFKNRIFLDERARSTVGNAIEVRYIVEKLNAKSLLLVTSTYHIRRARELVERSLTLPPVLKLEIYEDAVASPNFAPGIWYKGLLGWQIVLSEYFKTRLGF